MALVFFQYRVIVWLHISVFNFMAIASCKQFFNELRVKIVWQVQVACIGADIIDDTNLLYAKSFIGNT